MDLKRSPTCGHYSGICRNKLEVTGRSRLSSTARCFPPLPLNETIDELPVSLYSDPVRGELDPFRRFVQSAFVLYRTHRVRRYRVGHFLIS
ncbi:MAG: hypothetical protein WBD33_24365, partial [Xanthobacteraceae bacterium]